jgi:hypothetical protein
MIPQIASLISAARRQGACAQALATLEAAESLDQLEQEGQLFVWVLWAADRGIMPTALRNRYYRWLNVPASKKMLNTWEAYNAAYGEVKRETIRAARLWVETGALS